jgi:hypothetical protein
VKPYAKPLVFTQEIHCTSFSTSKRHDSNADDTDKSDLRGFLSRLWRDGKIATKAQSHQATKKTFSIQGILCLRALVAKKLCRRQSKIRVNPWHPCHPCCYYCRFGKNSVLVKSPDSVGTDRMHDFETMLHFVSARPSVSLEQIRRCCTSGFLLNNYLILTFYSIYLYRKISTL